MICYAVIDTNVLVSALISYYDILDYHGSEKAYPLGSSAKLYDFLLKKMNQGSEKYMSYR